MPASRTEADFLTSPSNLAARDAMRAWQNWPDRRMVLTGPEGSGKSHLAQIWSAQTGAETAMACDMTEPRLMQLIEAPAILIEDLDRVSDLPGPVQRQVETVLFHLYNLANERGIDLLFTGRRAPAHWRIETPDLASRVLAMAHVRIAEPDDALLASILTKLFQDRQIHAGDDVIEYLLKRIERSFASAERIVERLDRAALAGQRRITRPLAAEVLSQEET